MMCAQFVYGHFSNGVGLKMFQSKNLEDLLYPASITWLMSLGKNVSQYREEKNVFPTENCVAYTFLYPDKDEDGRAMSWNHTIVVSMKQVFDELTPIIRHLHRKPDPDHPGDLPPLRVILKG